MPGDDFGEVGKLLRQRGVTSMGQVTARTLVSFKLKKPADNLLRCQVYTSSQLTVEGKMKTTLVS